MNVEKPLISIIVPVYNAEKTLSKCVESILNQTHQDFELILINDGSKDNSLALCRNFELLDKRVIVINKSNGGVSSARNTGIDNAHGTWMVFVDSDDWIDPDYCTNLISVVSSPSCFVMTRHDFINKEVDSVKECSEISGIERIDFIIKNNILDFSGPYCKLFNIELIRNNGIRFPENINMGEDGIFLVKYLNVTTALTVRNINNYHYQNNSQSLSQKFYNFDSEYCCYKIWKREIESLFRNKNWTQENDFKDAIWKNRIGDTFIRCILCLSRQELGLNLKQIYNSLKSISDNDWTEFIKYYSPNTVQRRLLKMVYKYRIYSLDLLAILLDRLVNHK